MRVKRRRKKTRWRRRENEELRQGQRGVTGREKTRERRRRKT